jgi:hypothetical protein
MTTFTIDNENNITAFADPKDAQALGDQIVSFTSEREFAKATAEWPTSRFVETWNNFAGVVPFDKLKPVKKFTDRKTAVSRIWNVIQQLAPAAPQDVPTPSKKAKPAKRAKKDAGAPTAREGSKKAMVLDMMRRKEGATLKEIMSATDWQAHSVRGFISIAAKKMGLKIESTRREDGERLYHAE